MQRSHWRRYPHGRIGQPSSPVRASPTSPARRATRLLPRHRPYRELCRSLDRHQRTIARCPWGKNQTLRRYGARQASGGLPVRGPQWRPPVRLRSRGLRAAEHRRTLHQQVNMVQYLTGEGPVDAAGDRSAAGPGSGSGQAAGERSVLPRARRAYRSHRRAFHGMPTSSPPGDRSLASPGILGQEPAGHVPAGALTAVGPTGHTRPHPPQRSYLVI